MIASRPSADRHHRHGKLLKALAGVVYLHGSLEYERIGLLTVSMSGLDPALHHRIEEDRGRPMAGPLRAWR